MEDLRALGFDLVGYGCTTCIGNSGPLPEPVAQAIDEHQLVAAAVLSGNRNFEGRVHPQVKANYLASPPLVVAYALAGSLKVDLTSEPLGTGSDGQPVYLRDIWPSPSDVQAAIQSGVNDGMFRSAYADVFKGDEHWAKIGGRASEVYDWDDGSTYVKQPPYFAGHDPRARSRSRTSRARACWPCSATASPPTTSRRPAPSRARARPADYFMERQVRPQDFNSYGSRRGNHEVMMRGTFANIRLRNEVAPGTEGGWTRLMPEGEEMSIFDAAMKYQERGVPLVVIGGKEYGSGTSRDWAAKGTLLLGVKAVIAESFERIHRSNLVGMGVLPLTFKDGMTRKSLELDGSEVVRHRRPRRRHQAAPGRAGDDHPRRRPHGRDQPALPDRHPRRGRLLPPRRHPALRAPPAARARASPRGTPTESDAAMATPRGAFTTRTSTPGHRRRPSSSAGWPRPGPTCRSIST